jgi:hypothetical protein
VEMNIIGIIGLSAPLVPQGDRVAREPLRNEARSKKQQPAPFPSLPGAEERATFTLSTTSVKTWLSFHVITLELEQ